jgi:uncharacterized glyoxalase superfamily protein PhnB
MSRSGITQRTSAIIRAGISPHYSQSKRAGAQTFCEPTTFPYGERQYTAKDLGGHVWTFSQSIVDVDPSSWVGTLIEHAV